MLEKTKKLIVCLFNTKVGVLTEKDGRLSFQYDQTTNVSPISVSMPVKEEPYNNNDTQKFFANLLPEGDPREKIAKFYNIKENLFPMLNAIGGECAGAISLYSEENYNKQNENNNNEISEFSREEFNEHIKGLPNRPLSVGNRVRLSLAGAQAKTAVLIKEKDFPVLYPYGEQHKFEIYNSDHIRIYKPSAVEFSTHIVKPPIKHLQDTVYNEFFCMLLAYDISREDGMDSFFVPRVTLYRDNDVECLFVQRYDRFFDEEEHRFKRLHQEDLCQVLSIYPEKKYQEDGGVSIKQCFKIIDENITFKIQAIDSILNIIIFNYLIGNCDAHGKNYSIIHNSRLHSSDDNQVFGNFYQFFQNNIISLAPFYDLMSTEIYDKASELGETQKMAMAIGGEYNSQKITLAHFERMAKELDMKPNYIIDKIQQMSSIIAPKAETLRLLLEEQNIISPVFKKIIQLIQDRVKLLK